MHKVTTQRGVSWPAAMEIYTQHDGDQDGFYMPKQATAIRPMPLLAFCLKSQRNNDGKKRLLYRVVRPNTGMQSSAMEFDKLTERYSKVGNPADCQDAWTTIYKDSAKKCIHVIQRNYCPRITQRTSQVSSVCLSIFTVAPSVDSSNLLLVWRATPTQQMLINFIMDV